MFLLLDIQVIFSYMNQVLIICHEDMASYWDAGC
jgi:hypothetical protein